jgi:hypothetical protein
MVELDAEKPTVWWTFDSRDELNEGEVFGDRVWGKSHIESFVIDDAEIRFDVPDDWGWTDRRTGRPIVLRRGKDGKYRAAGNGYRYEMVRADSRRNAILTGRWDEDDAGQGVMIISLPLKQQNKPRRRGRAATNRQASL